MGVPVVIATGGGGLVVLAAETAGTDAGCRAARAGAAAGRRDHGMARGHAQGARL
jgi:hypothetical protein